MSTDTPDEDQNGFGDASDRDGEDMDDSPLESEAEVICPYCGAWVALTVDPAGGSRQQYVEDCEVCCQPWSVIVQFDGWGAPEVIVEQAY